MSLEGVSREEFFDELCPPLPGNHERTLLGPEAIVWGPPGEHARRTWSDEKWRLYRWLYCRLTEVVDAHIGKILSTVRNAGLEEDTLIIFMSDHGEMESAHRATGKGHPYEESARVPFIVNYRGDTQPEIVDTTHLVSTGLDLIPTMCDYTGIDPPPGLLGRSLRQIASGQHPPSWRDQVVVECFTGRMLRTSRHKYTVYDNGSPREQLIDMVNDPGEMLNLAEDPDYQEVLNQCRERLRQWVEETGDSAAASYIIDTQL
jgi:arylsulfatase A-like enzyme